MSRETKFMTRVYSAQENNESKLLTQIYADIQEAQNMGQLVTKQLDYEKLPNGTIRVKDKVNQEVTDLDASGDQIVMTPMSWGSTPPADNIVGELEGTPSIPDDIQRADSGVLDKEKAGLVGNDDTHYPTLTFSEVHPVYSQQEITQFYSEILGSDVKLFANSKEAQQKKANEAKEEQKSAMQKLVEMEKNGGFTRGEYLMQKGKVLMSQAKSTVLRGLGNQLAVGAISGVIGGALSMVNPIAGATTIATGALRSPVTILSAISNMPTYIQGKKMYNEGKKLVEQENKDPELKKRNTIPPRHQEDTPAEKVEAMNQEAENQEGESKNMSAAGKADDLQLIVGKLTSIKNANSNSEKHKIVLEMKKISENINDPKCKKYLVPMIKELEKRSIREDDFQDIIDDFIDSFSNNPVTKVFNE